LPRPKARSKKGKSPEKKLIGGIFGLSSNRRNQTDQNKGSSAGEPPTPTDPPRRALRRTSESLLDLGSHTVIMVAALASIWLIHLVLEALLGKDAKFFDLIPIRWIIDLADVLVVGKFLLEVIRDFSRKRD
jgi:hypothetical protein